MKTTILHSTICPNCDLSIADNLTVDMDTVKPDDNTVVRRIKLICPRCRASWTETTTHHFSVTKIDIHVPENDTHDDLQIDDHTLGVSLINSKLEEINEIAKANGLQFIWCSGSGDILITKQGVTTEVVDQYTDETIILEDQDKFFVRSKLNVASSLYCDDAELVADR